MKEYKSIRFPCGFKAGEVNITLNAWAREGWEVLGNAVALDEYGSLLILMVRSVGAPVGDESI